MMYAFWTSFKRIYQLKRFCLEISLHWVINLRYSRSEPLVHWRRSATLGSAGLAICSSFFSFISVDCWIRSSKRWRKTLVQCTCIFFICALLLFCHIWLFTRSQGRGRRYRVNTISFMLFIIVIFLWSKYSFRMFVTNFGDELKQKQFLLLNRHLNQNNNNIQANIKTALRLTHVSSL